jgi:predicted TPR repeat methyltransferase
VPAIEAYRRVLLLAPALAEAQAELADVLQQAGFYASSLPPLRQVLSTPGPHSAARFNTLGVALRAHGDTRSAVDAFCRAVVLRPESAKAQANLAGGLRLGATPANAVAPALHAVHLDPTTPESWLELGQSRHAAGQTEGALRAYRAASALAPGDIKPLWLQAELLDTVKRSPLAVPLYRRVLALAPDDHFGAEMALAHLGMAPPPAQAPSAHVRTLYDQYASTFDANLVEDLGYRGPAIVAEAVVAPLGRGPHVILDAGCGTGLSGIALRPIARTLHGIDLSPRMIDGARARALYDSLVVGDLVSALHEQPATYDLVAAVDVLIYQGDLTPVLTAAYGALKPGGGLVFTVERADRDAPTAPPFVLRASTGRYAHSESHIRAVAAHTGFEVLSLQTVSTRREGGKPVPGLCCVLQKS